MKGAGDLLKESNLTWRRFLGILRPLSMILHRGPSRVGAGLVGGLFGFVFLVSILSPYSPTVVTGLPNSPPTLAHPFGTDYVGQDVTSQLAWGAYPSLFVSFSAAIASSLLGFFVGLLSGYYRRLGAVLGAVTDIVLTLPNVVLLLIIGSLYQPTNELLITSLSLLLWPSVARGVRAQVQSLVNRPYVDAARSSGMSDRQIILRTLAPKVGGIAMAYFILNVALSMVIVTALEFLGLGNPAIPSWGGMLFFAQSYGIYVGDWWWMLAPGLAITIFAVGFALVGYAIEEMMNPRLRVK